MRTERSQRHCDRSVAFGRLDPTANRRCDGPFIGLAPDLDEVQNPGIVPVVRDDPANILEQHGVQVTAQRLAVLRAVSAKPHRTADEVAEIVRGKIGTISRQAVYDALAVLTEKRIIRRIEPAGSPARYEDRVGDNHHHSICRVCGLTVDVDCAIGAAPCLSAAVPSGFQIDEAEVIYWGTCAKCHAKGRGSATR